MVGLIPTVLLAVLVGNTFFGGLQHDDSMGRTVASVAIAMIPIGIYMFWSTSTFNKATELGTKLVNDFKGDGWLPSGARLHVHGEKVTVILKGGQELRSNVEEIVVGPGRWFTTKQVALDFDDAVAWRTSESKAVH